MDLKRRWNSSDVTITEGSSISQNSLLISSKLCIDLKAPKEVEPCKFVYETRVIWRDCGCLFHMRPLFSLSPPPPIHILKLYQDGTTNFNYVIAVL